MQPIERRLCPHQSGPFSARVGPVAHPVSCLSSASLSNKAMKRPEKVHFKKVHHVGKTKLLTHICYSYSAMLLVIIMYTVTSSDVLDWRRALFLTFWSLSKAKVQPLSSNVMKCPWIQRAPVLLIDAIKKQHPLANLAVAFSFLFFFF